MIELIVVIILLGIITSVAAPKFIDLSSDAKVAKVSSFLADMKATAKLFHYKTVISGQTSVDTELGTIYYTNDYPRNRSYSNGVSIFFLELQGFTQVEFPMNGTNTRAAGSNGIWVYERKNASRIGYGEGDLISDGCFAEYVNDKTNGVSFRKVTTGC